MTKSYALFSAAVLLCACGGSSFKPTFTPAAKGTTTGTMATQMIDGSGGTVVSADGRLEVIVPAGMFTSATQVGIQPITNTAPNGVGVAYRLTPEGSMFSQAVTVKFHLNGTQMMGLDSTFIASQHADGVWYSQPHQARDATAQTVSVPAKHFSDWAVAQTVFLSPQQTRVRAGTGADFKCTIVAIDPDDDLIASPTGDEELAVPNTVPLNDQIAATHTWEVNSVERGNDVVGHIEENQMMGNYTAPTSRPNPSEVTVSVTVMLGKTKLIAPAKADIYSEEVWNGTSDVTLPDGTKVASTFTFGQVSDDGHGKLQLNVKNGNVHATVPSMLTGGCTQTATPTDYTMGPNDGQMTVTNDLSGEAELSGMGTSVWLATYTTVCPNGPGSYMAAIQAQWWPLVLGSAPMTIQTVDGAATVPINANGVTGTLTLTRQ